MTIVGLRDNPIESLDQESLGFGSYAKALATFAIHCDTPMTIAIQGDWGSGKTSLLNMVRQAIDEDATVRTIWFNTWHHSQFGLGDTLTLSLLSEFVQELGGKTESSAAVRTLLSGAWRLGRAVAVGGASFVGQADLMKTFVKNLEEGGAGEGADPAGQVRALREKLAELVKEKLASDEADRLVVIVDDIDRLQPIRAVELLESLKVFLDIQGCVFLLACDHRIVAQGLRQKFPDSHDAAESMNFFDKIIQLPFTMPVREFNVEPFFQQLLTRTGVEFAESDLHAYVDLVNRSVGLNPRTIKRLVNSLLLLRLVVQEDLLSRSRTQSDEAEKMRILFAVLCLQYAFEPLYKHLQKHDLTDELLAGLRAEPFYHESEMCDVREELEKTGPGACARAAAFMDVFHGAVQLKGNEDLATLSDAELASLDEILMLSSVVSTDATWLSRSRVRKSRFRRLTARFVDELCTRHEAALAALGDECRLDFALGRAREDMSIRITLHWLDTVKADGHLRFTLDKDELRISVRSSSQRRGRRTRKWVLSVGKEAFPGSELGRPEGCDEQLVAMVHREGFSPQDSMDTRFRRYRELTADILAGFLPFAARAGGSVDDIEVDDTKEVPSAEEG